MEFSLDYITNVYQEARDIVRECCPDFKDPTITFKLSKARSFWAYVEKKGSNYFWIRISDVFCRFRNKDEMHERLLETLIHELAHTIPGCMNHKAAWKSNCSRVRNKYPKFDLQRCEDFENYGIEIKERSIKYLITCEHCGHTWEYKRKPKWIERADRCQCPYCMRRGMKVESV